MGCQLVQLIKEIISLGFEQVHIGEKGIELPLGYNLKRKNSLLEFYLFIYLFYRLQSTSRLEGAHLFQKGHYCQVMVAWTLMNGKQFLTFGGLLPINMLIVSLLLIHTMTRLRNSLINRLVWLSCAFYVKLIAFCHIVFLYH